MEIVNATNPAFNGKEDRAWALDNGPWCVRGYSLILTVWSPRNLLSVSFDSMNIWLQIHNLPRDYFSVENGKLLGGKAGRSDRDVYRRKSLPSTMDGSGNRSSRPIGVVSGSKRTMTGTGQLSAMGKLASQKLWRPKRLPVNRTPTISSLGNKVRVGEDDRQKGVQIFPCSNLNVVDWTLTLHLGSNKGVGLSKEDIGPALSTTGPIIVDKKNLNGEGPSCGPCMPSGHLNEFKASHLNCGTPPTLMNQLHVRGVGPKFGLESNGLVVKDKSLDNFTKNFGIGKEVVGPAPTISNESSICGQEVNFHHDEKLALTKFFQAQDSLVQELKKFGNLDLYEIKSIGGDIGVPTASETNERTTPFKKQKFDGASASLCSRP
ncbi:hypothetical protein G4B88_007726 [Cannabis sativa]|uniref:DUF4283 domain-containing protein n=1 Tax=Cannabis sativa TaxID=3483 RepID=A0A7J6HH92_CANSA|nr:hypothetical protein G4B88_007726 [Cannabis sativa]